MFVGGGDDEEDAIAVFGEDALGNSRDGGCMWAFGWVWSGDDGFGALEGCDAGPEGVGRDLAHHNCRCAVQWRGGGFGQQLRCAGLWVSGA